MTNTAATTHMFATDLQTAVYYNTYARWNTTTGRRETWTETVERVVAWMQKHIEQEYPSVYADVPWHDLTTGMLDLAVLPSMRLVQMAGPALDRCHVGVYNCAYLPLTKWQDFGDLLYILMQGTGCGFSVEHQYINQLPVIMSQTGECQRYVIPDTTDGWCDALVAGLNAWATGSDIEFDYSQIRPAGTPLLTKGGKASGPEPLRQLLDYARTMLLRHQGRKLSSLNAHDLACFCGSIVQVGGVRRSAEISLSDRHDDAMAMAKMGQFWQVAPERSMANNSAVYTEKPGLVSFITDWQKLISSGTGERGVFNRGALNRLIPVRRTHRDDWGVNPCVPGSTQILTRDGYQYIDQCVGVPVDVWNGFEWSTVTPFATGNRPVYRVHLSSGNYLDCTDNHEWVLASGERVQTAKLEKGMALLSVNMPMVATGEQYDIDAYSQGFYSGDGNENYTFSYVYEPKYSCITRLIGECKGVDNYGRRRWRHGDMYPKAWVPIHGTATYCINWLAGLLDADGTVAQNPNSISLHISSINKTFLQDVQLMLTRLGVQAKIGLMKAASDCGIDGYATQNAWRLCINSTDTLELIAYGLHCERLRLSVGKPNRDARRFVRIAGVEPIGNQDTYCFTEPKRHMGTFNGIVTGQCGEIILRPYQFCNLSICVARPEDDLATLRKKIELASIWGTLQSTLTKFRYVNPLFVENCADERLLGVDITGQMDNPYFKSEIHRQLVYTELKNMAVSTNQQWATKLGINPSAAVTCVKPSGNSSQLLNTSSGIHPRYAEYYVRRIRVGAHSPVAAFLRASGVPCFPEIGQNPNDPSVWVFEFPVKSPTRAHTRDQSSALDQLDRWLVCKRHYTEHNPSCTVYVKDHEWLEVGGWVYNNWDHIGGLSFLPHDGGVYKLAPYEAITEAEYQQRQADWPVLDWSRLAEFEHTDTTELNREYSCTGDRCEI